MVTGVAMADKGKKKKCAKGKSCCSKMSKQRKKIAKKVAMATKKKRP